MNLTKEQFIEYIDAMRLHTKTLSAFYAAGVEIRDDAHCAIFGPLQVLLDVVFSQNQMDTVDWWLFDRPKGIKDDPIEAHMWDAAGTPIPLLNAGELYDYLWHEE